MIQMYERESLPALIGQAGGQLGLWTGMSIITLYHAIIYLLAGALHGIRLLMSYFSNDTALQANEAIIENGDNNSHPDCSKCNEHI
jgi:hypothetical protein